jgi:hypothetical protein
MGRGEVNTGFRCGGLREIYQLDDPGVDGRVILKWILRHWIGGRGMDWSGLEHGEMAGSCKRANET